MSNMLSRLATWQLHLIGAITAIILAAILFFLLIKPKTDQVASVVAETKSDQDAGGTQEKVDQHQKDLQKATKAANDTRAAWQVNEHKYMPNLNFNGDLLATYQYKLINIPTDWGRWITAWYDTQRKLGVSRGETIFPIEAFPTDPNQISSLSSLQFPTTGSWPVTVEAKSFDAAMAHLRSFNTMEGHGMPVVNDVSLAGQSPNLVMNYDLALYVILESPPPPQDPSISPNGGATGTSGVGMMGGGRMGMMGGPPGMMGGPMMGGPPGMMGGPPGMAGAAGRKRSEE